MQGEGRKRRELPRTSIIIRPLLMTPHLILFSFLFVSALSFLPVSRRVRCCPSCRARGGSGEGIVEGIAEIPSPSLAETIYGFARCGNPWEYMLDLGRSGYNGVTRVALGPAGEFYFLLSPESVREVIVEQADESFPQRFSIPLFTQLGLDRGIVYEQGDRHRRQKRVCLPSFEQARSMDSFLAAIFSETSTLADSWRLRLPEKGGTSLLDLYTEARKLTLEVVLRVSFGISEDFERSDELSRTIGDYLTRIVATANEIPPLWQVNPKLSSNYRAVTEDLLPNLRELVSEVIAQRRRSGDGASKGKSDLLGVLLEAEGIDDDDIQAILFDLVIAGSDTAASTITATIFLLHSPLTPPTTWGAATTTAGAGGDPVPPRPAIEVAREEVADAVARFSTNTSDSFAALAAGLRSVDDVKEHLPFVTACVKETLRLFPPVPFIGRRSVQPSTVSSGCPFTSSSSPDVQSIAPDTAPGTTAPSPPGYAVPTDAVMCWSPWFLGRDERHWRAPVGEFRPTRWAPGNADFLSPATGLPRSPFSWLPFGAGPRGCLGTRLGLNEAVVATALLLHAFNFRFGFVGEDPISPGGRSSAPGVAEARKIAAAMGIGRTGGNGALKFKYDLTLNLDGRCFAAVSERAHDDER